MCKVVFLTSRKFDSVSAHFRRALADELKHRGIEVVSRPTCWMMCRFRKHKTFGMAIGIDFFHDKQAGRGLTLSESCPPISREFAYNVSNALDTVTPRIPWRDFRFVSTVQKKWQLFFKHVNASTKAIFYICTYNNPRDLNVYHVTFEKQIQVFAEEIVRCLRSGYDVADYQKRVKVARLKISKANENL